MLSGNSAYRGGAVAVGGGLETELLLSHSLLSQNTADVGGDLCVVGGAG